MKGRNENEEGTTVEGNTICFCSETRSKQRTEDGPVPLEHGDRLKAGENVI